MLGSLLSWLDEGGFGQIFAAALVICAILHKILKPYLFKTAVVSIDDVLDAGHEELAAYAKLEFPKKGPGFVLYTQESMALAKFCPKKLALQRSVGYFERSLLPKVCKAVYRPDQLILVDNLIQECNPETHFVLVMMFPKFPVWAGCITLTPPPSEAPEAEGKKDK